MLRVAVPNKGTLSAPAAQMLREAGYQQRIDSRDLICRDAGNDLEFFYLRPRDIATYVGSGDLDLGITGRDLLIDAGVDAEEILDLGFGAATFRFAARPATPAELGPAALSATPAELGQPASAAVAGAAPALGRGGKLDFAQLAGLRIATAYPGVVTRHLAEHGVTAQVVRLDGAVENAVRLGVADLIADVVETGATLRQAGLAPIGAPILRSSAILIRRNGSPANGAITQLLRRLQGVLVARRYVMLAYDVRADLLDVATSLTPGIESPTVSPLHREGWVAVQAMVERSEMHRIMDELYDLGARAILVTDIHATRL